MYDGKPTCARLSQICMQIFDDLSLAANLGAFAVSAAVVWFAGTRLATHAAAIADRTGVGQATVGVLLLGCVTSLPELAVAVTATLAGHPALSVNDVIGSAAINVLILALADAALGRDALTSTLASPGALLQGVLSALLLVLAAGAAVTGDVGVLGMGLGSWLLVAAYAVSLRLVVHAPRRFGWVPVRPPRKTAKADTPSYSAVSSGYLALRTGAYAAAILGAGFMLAQTGAAIANQTGIGTNFVGAVMLAFATSLPEVSTVVAAVRMKRYEMAISDIFGTNLFNVLIIAAVDLLHPGPPVLGQIGVFAAFGALLAAFLTLLFVVGMVERRDRTVLRMGLDSLAAIACYAGGLAVLYHLK